MGFIKTIRLLSVGSCSHRERLSIRHGGWGKVRFPAICALIEHSSQGFVLYDTGYNTSMDRAVARGRLGVYAKLMDVRVSQEEDILEQICAMGVIPSEINRVILSHFHPDHIGSARSFVGMPYLCSREGYEIVARKNSAINSNGFFSELLPDDFDQRVRFVEDLQVVESKLPLERFTSGFDIFGDGSLISILMDGHAKSQVGLLATGGARSCFLVSDAAWSRDAIFENRPPSAITAPIQQSWPLLLDTLSDLHRLHCICTDLVMVPSHCQQALRDRIIEL